MKCAFIIPSLGFGGAEKVFASLVSNWNSEDECHLIVLDSVKDDNSFIGSVKREKVFYLGQRRVGKAVWPLLRLLKRNNYDAVFTTLTHLNIIVLLLSLLTGDKVIIREASVPSINQKLKRTSIHFKILMKLSYPFAHKVVCQSRDIYKEMESIRFLAKHKLIIINNPITRLNPPLKIDSVNSGILKIVFLARFSPEKGHDRLLQILSLVRRPYELHLIGEGTLYANFVKSVECSQFKNKVFFHGWNDNPEQLIKSFDLYIQSSYVEGFPNALLEACSIGLPVIAYNVLGGTKEIVNSENGILIEDGNFRQFALAIENFRKERYDSIKIRKDIFHRFSMDTIVAKYRSLVVNLQDL